MKPSFPALALLAGLSLSGASQAALVDRGGGLIYDSDLKVTWLADANYAKTSRYDADGLMTWSAATTWAANLVYGGYTDWRLPTTTDTGAPGCDYANSGTDCGYNSTGSEMAHLYFTELGNQSYYTPTGAVSGAYASGTNPYSTLDNVGPFINFQSYYYWSGTEYAPNTANAWLFRTTNGFQDYNGKTVSLYALAVRPGDVAAVPEADAWAMLLAGLGLVGAATRRRRG